MRVSYDEYRGKLLPKGYGVAWRDWVSGEMVIYLMPFNIIARWARELYWKIKNPRSTLRENEGGQAYYRGYDKGFSLGRGEKVAFEKAVQEEVTSRIERTLQGARSTRKK